MDEVSLYYFGNVSNTWPGKAMKKDVSGKYYVDVPKIPTEGDTTPMQVNMHVDLSYDNVNLTYTTKGPADGTVTVKDAVTKEPEIYDSEIKIKLSRKKAK